MDITRTQEWVETDPRLSPVTRKSYAARLTQLAKVPGFHESPSSAVVEAYPNKNSALSYLRMLKYLHVWCPHFDLGSDISELRLLQDQLAMELESFNNARERRENDVEWELVKGVESHINPNHFLLYKFMTEMPPRRSKDYAAIRILTEDDGEGNVYDQSTQQLIFRHYKTGSCRGCHVVDVPAHIVQLIPVDQKFMFENAYGEEMKHKAMSHRIGRMFEQAGLSLVGANTLRRSYASWQLRNNLTPQELARAAAELSHSSRTHMHYAFRQ